MVTQTDINELEAESRNAEQAYREASARAKAARAELGRLATDRIGAELAIAEAALGRAAEIARETDTSFTFNPKNVSMQAVSFTADRVGYYGDGPQEWYTSSDEC